MLFEKAICQTTLKSPRNNNGKRIHRVPFNQRHESTSQFATISEKWWKQNTVVPISCEQGHHIRLYWGSRKSIDQGLGSFVYKFWRKYGHAFPLQTWGSHAQTSNTCSVDSEKAYDCKWRHCFCFLIVAMCGIVNTDELWVGFETGKHVWYISAHSIPKRLETFKANALPVFPSLYWMWPDICVCKKMQAWDLFEDVTDLSIPWPACLMKTWSPNLCLRLNKLLR